MRAVAAPSDKRFRRAHVSPARKRGWKPSRGTLIRVAVAVVVAVLVVYQSVAFVFTTGALKVARITVDGDIGSRDFDRHDVVARPVHDRDRSLGSRQSPGVHVGSRPWIGAKKSVHRAVAEAALMRELEIRRRRQGENPFDG